MKFDLNDDDLKGLPLREKLECERLAADLRKEEETRKVAGLNGESLENLQLAKLQAELTEIKRPVYKRLQFWASAWPVLLASITAVWAWNSTWFDAQRAQLTLDKLDLRKANDLLQSHKDTLAKQVDELKRTQLSLEEANAAIKSENAQQKKWGEELRLASESLKNQTRMNETISATNRFLFESLVSLDKDRVLLQSSNSALRLEIQEKAQLYESELRRFTSALALVEKPSRNGRRLIELKSEDPDAVTLDEIQKVSYVFLRGAGWALDEVEPARASNYRWETPGKVSTSFSVIALITVKSKAGEILVRKDVTVDMH